MPASRPAVIARCGIGFALGLLESPQAGAAPAAISATPAPAGCESNPAVAIWISPEHPVAGKPVRIMAVSARPIPGRLRVDLAGEGASDHGARGSLDPSAAVARGGPPFSLAAAVTGIGAGAYQVSLGEGARTVVCRRFRVLPATSRYPRRRQDLMFWHTRASWDATFENLFSAWIESLFDAPPDSELAFRPLAQALRDPGRNFLHDHLGFGEDSDGHRDAIPAAPDCADLPYFLRAYFSWKLQLPFGFRDCDRGTRDRPPRCGPPLTNERLIPGGAASPPRAFRDFLRELSNRVQSGGLRTGLGDDESDFYPVTLDRESLRPGVIFADPYGHVLVLARWFAQRDGKPGLLFAVDGQPDTSITRKRFWEGNFLFASDIASAGAGWKAFRPLRRSGSTDAAALAAPSNRDLRDAPGFARASDQQAKLVPEAFYARMSALINPDGISAETAYDEMLDALVEQARARVRSVDNGESRMRETHDDVIAMPDGPAIFETVGAWEDYATPSRDMRILIAMKALLTLPARVRDNPTLYRLGGRSPAQAQKLIADRHARRIGEVTIEYRRSDGTPFRLSVADLMARRSALEMAYNPNDCVEIRWGAPSGSVEAATCKRHAPEDQRHRMAAYRAWFAATRRPPRD